jgi:NADH:ubiquinone oxidoreductase subunit 3 (subunit A)
MDSYTLQYSALAVFLAVAIIFPLLPLFLASIVSPKKPSPMKQSVYECGLESKGDPWGAFKVDYYVYALVFVAFDLEAPFLYAWAVVFHKMPVFVFVEMIVFIAVLVAGLAYAWKKGVLEWR